MIRWILGIGIEYLMVGCVFAAFILVSAKRPTVKLALFEVFCWPYRSYRGLRMMIRDAGKVDFDKPERHGVKFSTATGGAYVDPKEVIESELERIRAQEICLDKSHWKKPSS